MIMTPFRLRCVLTILLLCCMACAHPRVSPLKDHQMDAAIPVGAAALPYLVYGKAPLRDLDGAFSARNAAFRLEDAFQTLYGYSIADAPDHPEQTPVFTTMETATSAFRKLLASKSIPVPENYLMTAVDTAVSDGFILMAVVYRPQQGISVFNKFNFLLRQTLGPADPEFFRAYRVDVSGNPQDLVLDWAALPLDCVSTRTCQAVLLTLSANKILEKQAKEDYWPQERQWITGNHLSVLIKQDLKTSQILGLEKGFTHDLNISRSPTD